MDGVSFVIVVLLTTPRRGRPFVPRAHYMDAARQRCCMLKDPAADIAQEAAVRQRSHRSQFWPHHRERCAVWKL